MTLLVEHAFVCPHCWSEISMVLDLSTSPQDLVEDCEVCCQPVRLVFEAHDGELGSFTAEPA